MRQPIWRFEVTDCSAREIYLSDETYHRLIDAILNAEPCAWSGKVEKDQVMLAIGEAGSIWPEAIRRERNSITARAEID